MAEKGTVPDPSEFVQKHLWLVRPCTDYENEAKNCKRIKSRFHQYFIHGTLTDCGSWTKDAQNCEKCVIEHNDIACKDIIKNETERRLKRYQAHLNNDVWEKREKPPENWNNSLPEWWLEENKNSIFNEFKDEFQEYIALNEPKRPVSLCVIL